MLLSQEQAGALLTKLYRELQVRRKGGRTRQHFRGEEGRQLAAPDLGAEDLNDYFLGKHPIAGFSSPEWKEFTAGRYDNFADNWCAPVASAPAERLGVIGVKLPDADPNDDSAAATGVERALWSEWKRCEMESRFAQVVQSAIVQKRSFVSVWGELDGPDKGALILANESAEQCVVAYDAETRSKRLAGLKVWTDSDGEHATLYTPDYLYPYDRLVVGGGNVRDSGLIVISNADVGQWRPRGDGQPIPNHLGKVPIVEIPNRPVTGEPISDIAGVAALQDSINLLWLYLFNAADYASLPARVVLGQNPPKVPVLDENGQKVGERSVDIEELRKGRMLWLSGQNTKVDQWDAANLQVFTDVIEIIVGHVAAQTRTPPHYLVANKGLSNLSGDALKAAETGLVMKVMQDQEFIAPRLRDVFELIAIQTNQPNAVVKACRLASIRWKDAENRSDAQQSDAMLKDKQSGYPFEWLLMKRGHSPEEIQQIMAMKRSEAALSIQQTVQSALRLPPPVQPDAVPPFQPGQ